MIMDGYAARDARARYGMYTKSNNYKGVPKEAEG